MMRAWLTVAAAALSLILILPASGEAASAQTPRASVVSLLAPAHGAAFAFGRQGHLLTSAAAVKSSRSVRLMAVSGQSETAAATPNSRNDHLWIVALVAVLLAVIVGVAAARLATRRWTERRDRQAATRAPRRRAGATRRPPTQPDARPPAGRREGRPSPPGAREAGLPIGQVNPNPDEPDTDVHVVLRSRPDPEPLPDVRLLGRRRPAGETGPDRADPDS